MSMKFKLLQYFSRRKEHFIKKINLLSVASEDNEKSSWKKSNFYFPVKNQELSLSGKLIYPYFPVNWWKFEKDPLIKCTFVRSKSSQLPKPGKLIFIGN